MCVRGVVGFFERIENEDPIPNAKSRWLVGLVVVSEWYGEVRCVKGANGWWDRPWWPRYSPGPNPKRLSPD
jgi:hypothetical protein